VLIVDDQPDFREMIREILDLNGFETLTAGDGIEAIGLARLAAPAAMTLDLAMPRQDGETTLRLLAADPATRLIPVVVVSGSSEDLVAPPQVVDVVSKPFDVSRLLDAVELAIAHAIV
jgi:CheY-like chemotaxis protein